MPTPSDIVRVNFGAPMPLFPLAGGVLLPHAVLPLHIFEERYRQMVEHALDRAGQIAMGVFEGDEWKHEYHGNPPVRPVVCVGQVLQHEKLPDGRFNILLRGICRARMREHMLPDDDHQYRRVMLDPLETPTDDDDDAHTLPGVRDRLCAWFGEPPLTSLAAAGSIENHLQTGELPISALLDLLAITVVTDQEMKYRLLAEPAASGRAAMIESEILNLRSLLSRAERQLDPDTPRGVTWN
ncbi:MAG: LON peptidase substrate-binding domain-containing protein [Phycisphaerales bacterium]